MEIKELTKAEEEIMWVLWDLQQAFVKEIVQEMPDPKPAYNTVSTIIRILEQKEIAGHHVIGKSHRYYPRISKETYSRYKIDKLMRGYFEGSLSKMVSFFMEKKDVNAHELDEILKIIQKKKE